MKAPDFTLPDQDGKERTLAEFNGKWLVLYFYPEDDTPGCTTEATEFTALLPEFQRLNATVIGVSPDDKQKHCEFIRKHGLGLTLLTDKQSTVMKEYGAYDNKVIRSTTLINPRGELVHQWRNVSAPGHAKAVLNTLRGQTS